MRKARLVLSISVTLVTTLIGLQKAECQKLCPVLIQVEEESPRFIFLLLSREGRSTFKKISLSDTLWLAAGKYMATFDTSKTMSHFWVPFEVVDSGTKLQLFKLKPLALVSPIIYFDKNAFSLNQDAKAGLQAFMSQAFPENQTVKLVLKGYCDKDGDRQYNLSLAEARIKAVQNFLSQNKQLEVSCCIRYGESLAKGRSAEEMALDRKVVIAFFREELPCKE